MGPIHPALVHFPIALLALSVLADIVGAWMKEPAARTMGFWSLVGATVGANAAVMAGLYDTGTSGMHAMVAPANTAPMMAGKGPFGPMEMGGMFTVVKVREGIASYDDPGWYRHPDGTVARKVG